MIGYPSPAQYKDAVYPNGTTLAGKPFDPANGQVNSYSSDVLIPAFLAAYTSNGGSSLNIFPALSQLLPNWTLRYSGLGKLPWFRDVFKSVNINHSYKSIYSVGAFNSYSNYVEYMDGLGFVADAMTGNPVPSSMYNVSTVSINEAFSPLLGVDEMFVHANALELNTTNLEDHQLAVFIRLGSDYKSNYYEYEIPLTLTPPGHYDMYSLQGCRSVWPEENMLDIPLDLFTQVKRDRNIAKAQGQASYNLVYTAYDENRPNNKISVMGNPSLGEVKTMIVGVRNLSGEMKSGEVWINELRLKEYNNEGGWAAQGNFNLQLSDLGVLNVQGRYISEGFGGLEEGVAQRSNEDLKSYTITTNVELGKFFPDKAKVSAPLYYTVSKNENRPKYNPLDTDMRLKEALNSMENAHERDSLENIAVTKTTNTNFSLSNVRVGIQNKRHPTPIDPANFSFTYSHSHSKVTGETTVYEKEDNWRGAMNYSWTPVFKPLEPFKKLKSKSKWLEILKRFGLNWLPQNVGFNTEINRIYKELQQRDMEDLAGSKLPLIFNEEFVWNREFQLRWDLTKNLHMTFNSATHSEIPTRCLC